MHFRQSVIRSPTILHLETRIEVNESAIGRLGIGDCAWSRSAQEVLLIRVHLSGQFVVLSLSARRVDMTVIGSRSVTVQWELELRARIVLLLRQVHGANCISCLLFSVLNFILGQVLPQFLPSISLQ